MPGPLGTPAPVGPWERGISHRSPPSPHVPADPAPNSGPAAEGLAGGACPQPASPRTSPCVVPPSPPNTCSPSPPFPGEIASKRTGKSKSTETAPSPARFGNAAELSAATSVRPTCVANQLPDLWSPWGSPRRVCLNWDRAAGRRGSGAERRPTDQEVRAQARAAGSTPGRGRAGGSRSMILAHR